MELLEDRTLLSAVYFEDFNAGTGGWVAGPGQVYQTSGGVDNTAYLEGYRNSISPNFNPVSGRAAANALGNLEALYGASIRISYFGKLFPGPGGNRPPNHGFYGPGFKTLWLKSVAASLDPFRNAWAPVSFVINTNWTDAEAEANGWNLFLNENLGPAPWSDTLHNVALQEVFYALQSPGIDGQIVSGIDNFQMESALPDIAPTSLTWNTTQGGVDFSYQITGADLTQDTTAALYWASGPTFADAIGGPIYSTTLQRAVGTYGPINVPASTLGSPPPGATDLLVVTDPANLIAESDETNNVISLGVTDVYMVSASTFDFVTIDYTYEINATDAPAFTVGFYLSPDPHFDPSTDTLLATQMIPASQAQQSNQPYEGSFVLSEPAQINDEQRFVLVVADPNGFLPETDKENNVSFAVPLFDTNERMNRIGKKDFAGLETSLDASGPYTGAILRGTQDFYKLARLDSFWNPRPTFDFLYHLGETKVWQQEEDMLAQESLLQPTANLVSLINNDIAGNLVNFGGVSVPDFWTGFQFSINEAYDSLGQHTYPSLHYEGRALDLEAIRNRSTDFDRLGRLAGLAWLAGFDWVLDEANLNHVHVSKRASFATTIDPQSLREGVQDALNLGRIDNAGFANSLVRKLDFVQAALAIGDVAAASATLIAFEKSVIAQEGKHVVDIGFAKLLLANVDILRSRIDVFAFFPQSTSKSLLAAKNSAKLHTETNPFSATIDFVAYWFDFSAVLAEWSDYATRIANLMGTGSGPSFTNRLNSNYFLEADATVFDDGAQDQLTGSAGQDWFFANIFDTDPAIQVG